MIKRGHPIYNLYYTIRGRCYHASKHNFPFYQGKGIKMCEEWLKNRNLFFEWSVNNNWQEGLTIDRIDSSKDYSPDNCRFISRSENSKKTFENGKRLFNPCAKFKKLTLEQVLKIKSLLIEKVKGVEIAKMFNVHKSCIYKIKHNKTWILVS